MFTDVYDSLIVIANDAWEVCMLMYHVLTYNYSHLYDRQLG